ncbi:MAG: hypothetical protein NT068_00570 [Candidatus Nomurabacteria bacterium]|nr:hypothetical protein [Candidatus Nomurabacteria bacterium]
MKFLYFIFSNLNAIILGFWILFLFVVSIRFFRPSWVKNISYLKLSFIAGGVHVAYSIFVTWGQYYVWSISSDITKALLKLPLSKEAPLPNFLEWSRNLVFDGHLGYFLYYVLGRIWFYTLLLFLTAIFFYLIFRIWKFYRGGFMEKGPEFLLVLMLVSGWPNIFVCISLGFSISILYLLFAYLFNKKTIQIEPFFIISTMLALLFTKLILIYLL